MSNILFIIILAIIMLSIIGTTWRPMAFIRHQDEQQALKEKHPDAELATVVFVTSIIVGQLAVLWLKDDIVTCESIKGPLFQIPLAKMSVRSDLIRNMRFYLHEPKNRVFRVFFQNKDDKSAWEKLASERFKNRQ